MGDVGSFVGTIATNVGSAAARLRAGFGARSVARSVVSTRPVARLAAGIENLLTAIATEVALRSPIASVLPMIHARLPPIAAAGDRMCGPITWRRDVDVVATAAPVDVAAPITSRPPVAEGISGAEGKPGRKQAVADIGGRRPVIGRIIRLGPGAVDHRRIVIGHI